MSVSSGSSVRELYGAQLTCLSPHVLYKPGEHQRVSPVTGRVDRTCVPCGRCRVCSASRKATWTGRLVAEALTSASVAFVTLTYKVEQEAFHYEHVQAMLKVFRINLWRRHQIKVRFFCVGERGELRGRIHWHLLFFFDKRLPGGLHDCPVQPTTKGELWEFWPYGWSSIWPLVPEEFTRRARYCAKYAVKDYLDPRSIMRCSLKPGIGSAYLLKQAEETARAGLVPHGGFKVPGIFVRGHEMAGVLFEHKLSGAIARAYIDKWSQLYFALYPDARYPANRFLRNFDENYVEPRSGTRIDWSTIADGAVKAPPLNKPRSAYLVCDGGSLMIKVGRDVAHLYVTQFGTASVDIDGLWYTDKETGGLFTDIRDVLVVDDIDATLINMWLEDVRSNNRMGMKYGKAEELRESWRSAEFNACDLERKAAVSRDPRVAVHAASARKLADEAFSALRASRQPVGARSFDALRREVAEGGGRPKGASAALSGAEVLAAERRRERENDERVSGSAS